MSDNPIIQTFIIKYKTFTSIYELQSLPITWKYSDDPKLTANNIKQYFNKWGKKWKLVDPNPTVHRFHLLKKKLKVETLKTRKLLYKAGKTTHKSGLLVAVIACKEHANKFEVLFHLFHFKSICSYTFAQPKKCDLQPKAQSYLTRRDVNIRK